MSKEQSQLKKNLFCTVLTYPSPSANYRGESEENRTVLQKISKDGKEYAIFELRVNQKCTTRSDDKERACPTIVRDCTMKVS